jgi:hypothetical protein
MKSLRILGLALPLLLSQAALAETLASSTFDSSPKPADPRFTLNGDGTLTAHYNTFLDTDKLLFPLSRPLTAADSFTYTTRFKILSAGFSAPSDQGAQIAFGLVNTGTTGNDRSGTLSTSGDTFDAAMVDYFPNVSPFFPSPTLSPTVFATRPTATAGAFDVIHSVYFDESALAGAGEGPLPLDTFMTATFAYNAGTHVATLSFANDAGPLLINAGGGADGKTSTIELQLPDNIAFTLDAFALTLWKDSWAFGVPSVQADVVFDSFSVATAPEPASLAVLGVVVPVLMGRKRR